MEEKSIKKNTIYNAIKTLSSILFPLITIPYINRVLLPENVGKINFGLSIVSYFELIATLGISTYAIRECSRVRDSIEDLSFTASQIFSINVLSTIVSYFLLAITLVFYRKIEGYKLLIIIQSANIVATTFGADWLNSAMEDFKYITSRTIIFQFLSLILLFVFVHKPDDYIRYAWISLVSSAGANLVNVVYRKRYCKVHFITNIISGIDWRRHLSPILLLFVMILAQNIYSNVDTTMLGLMKGDTAVGIYSTAHKVARIIFQVIISIAWVVMPRMSVLFANRQYKIINELLRKVVGFFMLIGVPCLVGTIMLSSDIILLVAGPEYEASVLVLRIRVVGLFFNLFGASFFGNIVLLPSKNEKVFMKICCMTAVVNLILNYILIPLYGAPAAAATTSFCDLFMLILFLVTKDRAIKIVRVGNLVIPPIIGSILIIPICIMASRIPEAWFRIMVSIGASVAVYCVIQLLGKNELFSEGICILLKKIRGNNN